MTTRPPVPATTTDVTGPVYITATTGLVMWLVSQFVFSGEIPPDVYVWVQLTVPLAMGRAAAAWRLRQARRRPRQFETE